MPIAHSFNPYTVTGQDGSAFVLPCCLLCLAVPLATLKHSGLMLVSVTVYKTTRSLELEVQLELRPNDFLTSGMVSV